MARNAAATELETEDADFDGDALALWGVDDDEDDQDTDAPAAESPELDDDDPTAVDPEEGEPDAPADPVVELPGNEATEPDAPAKTATVPSADADRPSQDKVADVPEVKPWTIKADGKEISVERSQIFKAKNADGTEEEYVIFPSSELKKLQPFLADRGTFRNEKKQLLQQLAELKPENHEEVVKAKELTAFLFGLFEKPEDEILDEISKFKAGRATWEAQQLAKSAQAKLTARESVTVDPDPELERIHEEERDEQLQGSLKTHIAELLKKPEFAGLDAASAVEDLWELRHKVFFLADEDMPQFGLKKGDIGINLEYASTRLQREATRLMSVRTRTLEAQRIQRENAEALGKKKPAAQKPAGTKPKAADDQDENPWAAVLTDDDN